MTSQILDLAGFCEFMTVLKENELDLRKWEDLKLFRGLGLEEMKRGRGLTFFFKSTQILNYQVEKVLSVVQEMFT